MAAQSPPCGTPKSVATTAEPSAALLPSQVLDAAADLIKPEGAWTTCGYARTARGALVGPLEEAAVCWCAKGAISRAAGEHHTHRAQRLWVTAAKSIVRTHDDGVLAQWNDAPERTQAEVVQALRDAAELARKEAR